MKKYLFLFIFFFFVSITLSADEARAASSLDQGLVGHWTMDGKDINWGTNTLSDSSGNGNTAQMIKMSTTTSPVVGKLGQALSFAGGAFTNPITSSATSFDFERTDTFSFSQWYNNKGGNITMATFLSNYNAKGHVWGIRAAGLCGVGQIGIVLYNSSTYRLTVCAPTNAGFSAGWHHIVMTYDGSVTPGGFHIYIDGVNQTLSNPHNTLTTQTIKSGAALVIGDDRTGDPFKGYMDDIRIYNRALSAGEVKQLYQTGASKFQAPQNVTGSSLDSGLAGMWTFDGSDTNWNTNTVTDASGNGNTGQMVLMSTTSSPVAGKFGQGLKFDGSTQYVNTDKLLSSFMTNSAGTISAWVKINTLTTLGVCTDGSNPNIFTDGATASGGYVWFGYDSGGLCAGGYSGGNVAIRNIPYTVGTWTMMTWVHSGGKLYLYKDGLSAATPVNLGNITSLAAAKCIIGKSISNRFFNGVIDDVRTYNRDLSATEIKQLYQTGANKFQAPQNVTGSSLDKGLVGMWTFDGSDTNWTTNQVADKSGNGNTGQMANMSTTTSPVAGKLGQGLKFNGTSQYVNITDSPSVSITGTMAVSVWVKPTAYATLNNFRSLVSNYQNSSDYGGYDLRLSNIGGTTGIGFATENDAGTSGGGNISYTLSLNTWSHIVGVYNGSNSIIYVNGNFVNQVANTVNPGNTSKNLYLGWFGIYGTSDLGRYFDGSLDDVRVYNRALSAEDVKQLYQLGSAKVR